MAKSSRDNYEAKKITIGSNKGKWRIWNSTKNRWAASEKLYGSKATAKAAIISLKLKGHT